MILTNCAACAAPLAHNAPRCVRCWTRYCNATCQHTYHYLGWLEEALRMRREVYSGRFKLDGKESVRTITAASNYAMSLISLKRFEEARSLLRKTMPVARRVLGNSDELMFKMNQIYARALCQDPGATLDDLREAVTKLEDVERAARQVFGGAHPFTEGIGRELQDARAALAAREAGRSVVFVESN